MTTQFSETITEYWHAQFRTGEVLVDDGGFRVVASPELSDDRRVMLLQAADGSVSAVLTPELAHRLGIRAPLSASEFERRLADAGIRLHGADLLFYFTEAEHAALLGEATVPSVRLLTERDRAAFAEFESAASEQDRDDAFVELEHWAVFGGFDANRLVCAASMYPWQDSRLADLGVLTLPPFRGRGHARRVVRAISRLAYERGYEPQYRCQLDNLASAALARAAGLTLFGQWDVVSPAG